MERQNIVKLISALELKYKTNKSFIPLADITESQEEIDYVLNNRELFFTASKSRIIMTHWLCREIRRVYENVAYVPIDFSNEVYEALRSKFKTKALNKHKLLELFDIKNDTIIPFEKFEEYEEKYTSVYNSIVTNEMKLPKINHIFIPDKSKSENLVKELEQMLTKKRVGDVLYSRANGETLDAIGTRHGITRERARQIEIRPKELIERWMDKRSDELIEIFGGNIIADKKKAENYFGKEKWQIIKYCASTKDEQKFSSWSYIPELDTICYSKDINSVIDNILQECANDNKTLDVALLNVHNAGYPFISSKDLEMICDSKNIHIYDGKMYSSKLNIGRGIIAAVNTEFKDGINISNKKQLKEFADFMNKKYGLDVKPDRALTARIQDILVMSGKATYKSPKFIGVSTKLDSEIKKYVDSIVDDRTTYQAVFNEIDKQLMEDCGITTFQGLHGYIKKNEKRIGVVSLRYYVCKDGTTGLKSKDFFEKFYLWLKELGRPATVDEIVNTFDGWNEMYPKYAMLYYPQIVQWGNGRYMNMDVFNIDENTVEKAKKVVLDSLENKIKYSNSYIITSKLKSEVPEFINNPLIESENHVFQLAKYYFGNDESLVFAKPHILDKSKCNKNDDFTTEDLIRLIIGRKNQIVKTELSKEILKYYGQKNSSLCLATQHVLKDFIRIDSDIYFKKSAIKFTADDILKIDEFVKNNFVAERYLVPDKLNDFSSLPKAPFEWTSWALCSIIQLYSENYKTVFKRNNIMQNSITIVEKTSKYETREQIAADILNNVYDGPRTKDSMIKYIKTLGMFSQSINFDDIEKEGIKLETTA